MNGLTELPTIPDKYRKNGFVYTKVLAGTRSLIFRQHVSESVHYFEVFKLKFKPPGTFKGKPYPASFYFPNNEAFGVWAWSCRTLEEAMTKFNELEGTGQ